MHRIIILPVVSYGCEILSPIFREEHSLKVFENGVLRGIFGSKREEVTGNCYDLHSSSNIIRVIKSRIMRLDGHVARREEKRCIQCLYGVS
jgi:hypothetical protein